MAMIESVKARIRKYDRFAWRVAFLLIVGIIVVGLAGCATTSPPPPVTYTLNVTVDPVGGGSVSPGSGTYDSGDRIILTATASPDYQFDHWSGDASGTSPTVTITMDSDKIVIAHYTEIIPEYTLTATVSPAEGGSVSPSSGVYQSDETVILTATASPRYQFDYWGGDASGGSTSTSVTMDSDKNVVAYFEKLYQTIEYTMPPGAASYYYVSYSKQLEAGETVDGFVELTGEYHSADQMASWNFQIFDPFGGKLLDWQGNVITAQHYDFNFTASSAGTYTLRVSHVSRYSKNLVIEIRPPGWSPMGA